MSAAAAGPAELVCPCCGGLAFVRDEAGVYQPVRAPSAGPALSEAQVLARFQRAKANAAREKRRGEPAPMQRAGELLRQPDGELVLATVERRRGGGGPARR